MDIVKMAKEAGWSDLRDFDSEMREDFFIGNTTTLQKFADIVVAWYKEELSKKIEKLPFGDTSQSFAIWVREQ